jgi:hypothetical protein
MPSRLEILTEITHRHCHLPPRLQCTIQNPLHSSGKTHSKPHPQTLLRPRFTSWPSPRPLHHPSQHRRHRSTTLNFDIPTNKSTRCFVSPEKQNIEKSSLRPSRLCADPPAHSPPPGTFPPTYPLQTPRAWLFPPNGPLPPGGEDTKRHFQYPPVPQFPLHSGGGAGDASFFLSILSLRFRPGPQRFEDSWYPQAGRSQTRIHTCVERWMIINTILC